MRLSGLCAGPCAAGAGGPSYACLATAVQAVHQRQQRGDNRVVNLILLAGPHLQRSGDEGPVEGLTTEVRPPPLLLPLLQWPLLRAPSDLRCQCTLLPPPILTGASPSISSKKMMAGWWRCASSNSSRSWRSASPTHLDSTSAPCSGAQRRAAGERALPQG